METADRKAMLLFEKYGDSELVATTVKELEQFRNQATNLGIMTSVAAFGFNELSRLAFRSRKLTLARLIIDLY